LTRIGTYIKEEYVMAEKKIKVKYMEKSGQRDIKTKTIKLSLFDLEQFKQRDGVTILTVDGKSA